MLPPQYPRAIPRTCNTTFGKLIPTEGPTFPGWPESPTARAVARQIPPFSQRLHPSQFAEGLTSAWAAGATASAARCVLQSAERGTRSAEQRRSAALCYSALPAPRSALELSHSIAASRESKIPHSRSMRAAERTSRPIFDGRTVASCPPLALIFFHI
jgi:hypothetical protein